MTAQSGEFTFSWIDTIAPNEYRVAMAINLDVSGKDIIVGCGAYNSLSDEWKQVSINVWKIGPRSFILDIHNPTDKVIWCPAVRYTWCAVTGDQLADYKCIPVLTDPKVTTFRSKELEIGGKKKRHIVDRDVGVDY